MPLTLLLPILGILVGVAGAAVGAVSTINANNYQMQVAERNRQLMEENAVRAIQAAQRDAQQQDETTRALIGEQIAAQSASGLSLGGRSQMLTRKSARELGRMDALNVRHAGEIEAYNFRVMALDEANKVQFLQTANTFALLTGFLDAASAGLTGISNSPKLLSSLMGARKPLPNLTRALPGIGDLSLVR